MGTGLSEAPLALFTTLAPLGVGAYLALALVAFGSSFETAVAKRVDKLSSIAFVIALIGFLASATHIGTVGNAFFIFGGVGSSPLSNEILAGVVFMVCAAVLTILAFAGTLTKGAADAPVRGGLRGILYALCAVSGIVFCVFIGRAYGVDTIPTWNTPLVPVQIIAFMLAGGPLLAAAILGLAKAPLSKGIALMIGALSVVGALLGTAALAMHASLLGGISGAYGSAADLVPALGIMIAVFALCAAVGVILFGLGAAFKRNQVALYASLGVIVVAVGVFMARIAFYGLEMTVGL